MKKDPDYSNSTNDDTKRSQNNEKPPEKKDKKFILWGVFILILLSGGGCLAYEYLFDTPTMVINDEHITKTVANKTYELDWTNNLNFEALNFGNNVEWSICYIQDGGHKETEDTTLKVVNFTYMLYSGIYHIKLKNDKKNLLACIKINPTNAYKGFLKNEINRLIQVYANTPSSLEGMKAKKILERIFSSGEIITLVGKDGNTIKLTIKDLLEKVTDGDEYSILTTPTINSDGKVIDIIIGKGKIDRPIASFSIPSTGYFDEPILFKNGSLNAESSEWNFGDGKKSTEESPTHIYSDNGKNEETFSVRLTIVGKNGKTDSMSKEIEISKKVVVVEPKPEKKEDPLEPVPPKAEFVIETSTPYEISKKIVFKNKSKHAERYKWDFGEGKGVVESNKTTEEYTYTKAGSFTVTLTAYGKNNTSDIAKISILVVDEKSTPFEFPNGNMFAINEVIDVGTAGWKIAGKNYYSKPGKYTIKITKGSVTIEKDVIIYVSENYFKKLLEEATSLSSNRKSPEYIDKKNEIISLVDDKDLIFYTTSTSKRQKFKDLKDILLLGQELSKFDFKNFQTSKESGKVITF